MLETFTRDPASITLSDPTMRLATRADAQYIAQRLRAQDTAEMLAMKLDPTDALMQSFERSVWCDVAEVDGRPVAIFGVCASRNDPDLGLPWLLGTHEMPGLGSHFVRGCRPVVDLMLATCPALVNLVHADNHVAQRWLAWLGFRFAYVPSPLRSQFVGFWQAREGHEQLAADWLMQRGFNTENHHGTDSSR